ncbi:hypothetical protein E2C01_097237 [Portunus trituberculatus]|uniref:Uncharacterized protein n=1 Tax=Portunus trituberculatus TaxID=210409 RepID=A0A5B7K577_PORTR|nr:hypothetical protein [Portunus trituberculatus]
MGMMREKNAKKAAAEKENEEGNELDTSHEDDEYEALIDYTLKVRMVF